LSGRGAVVLGLVARNGGAPKVNGGGSERSDDR